MWDGSSKGGSKASKADIETGYYDDYGNWIEYGQEEVGRIPDGNIHDGEGRLLDPNLMNAELGDQEDPAVFISEFKPPRMCSTVDAQFVSLTIFPDCPFLVVLQKLDIFNSETPLSQQAFTDAAESRRLRQDPLWTPFRSVFFLNGSLPYTKTLNILATGPPTRHKFIPDGKNNSRDLSTWFPLQKIHAYQGADRIPGAEVFFIDYCDSPDRYFISDQPYASLENRRLYQFAGYPATQYYILCKRVYHELLKTEGGSALTYKIVAGNMVYPEKGWRLTGSFYAFDKQLTNSTLFTVYIRSEPFVMSMIATGPIVRPEEWQVSHRFYAFDIALPGTCVFELQHTIRSIYSTASNVSRHRLSVEDAKKSWEFRMKVYVFPATIEDISLSSEPMEPGYT